MKSLAVWFLVIVLLILLFNPFGLCMRLIGLQPPYHWVALKVTKPLPDDLDEAYVDRANNQCGRLYRYSVLDDMYTVYGFGFSGVRATREQAEQLIEKECR